MPIRLTVIAASLVLAAFTAPAHAGIWTQVPSSQLSGVGGTITAIEYQSPTRLWFGTSTGEVWRRLGNGTFVKELTAAGRSVTDIEFQPGEGNNIGFAVGTGGMVFRSGDAGDTWVDVNPDTAQEIPVSADDESGGGDRCHKVDTHLDEDVFFVHFTAPFEVFIGSTNRRLAKSITGNATVGNLGTWVDANWDGSPARPTTGQHCLVPATDMVDLAPTGDTEGNFFYLFARYETYFTTNGLITTPTAKGSGGPANAWDVGGRVAVDNANASRQWAVMPAPYGISTTGFTQDGWSSRNAFRIVDYEVRDFPDNGAFDVDFAGGTAMAAGPGGLIINSTTGRDFYNVPADGTNGSNEWQAVSVADATRAAVGGAGGVLLLTEQANHIPDTTKPEGAITGPASVKTGVPTTYSIAITDGTGTGVDPAAVKWSVPGQTERTGLSATYTFATTGSFTITATFTDRAGNTNTATKFVSVSQGELPVFTFPATSKPPATARVRGGFVIVTIKGSFKVPPGVDASKACSGSLFFTVFKGKKSLRTGKGKLSGKCTFRKTLKIRRKKVGRSKRLKVRVRFFGNTYLRAAQKDYLVKVRRR